MRIFFLTAAVVVLVAGPAYAQDKHVPGYGEEEKDKTPAEKAADRAAEQAYKRSLSNIPAQGAADPWGNVRSDNAPKTDAKTTAKTAAKPVPSKSAKTDSTAK
jgi:hypothetical protein